ncbi:MAG: flagellar filament capping protein FliD [Synergistales bacterium]|nr:flagellar filament capping protein FliD [Synergistales bacterium]
MSGYDEPMFQMPGISSGIQWGDMIDEIMNAARAPKEQWEDEKEELQLEKSLFQEFDQSLDNLRSTLSTLKREGTYNTKQAEFTTLSPAGTDSNAIMTAEAEPGAAIGQWDIQVNQEAIAKKRIGTQFPSSSDPLEESGTLRIHVGAQWAEIDVATSDSLQEIRNSINQARGPGGSPLAVDAEIIDGRLVLTSSQTGLGSVSRDTDALVRSGEGYDYVPLKAGGDTIDPAASTPDISEISYGDTTYTEADGDFTFDESTGKITWSAADAPPEGATYVVEYASSYETYDNVFYLEDSSGTLVSDLGLDAGGDQIIEAQDADLTVNDVTNISRSSNEIDDLIDGVTLNIQGAGEVRMDITQDLEGAVKGIQSFVEKYNETMEWINIRVSEERVDNPEEDYEKRLGLLRGEPILWQTKSQLRQRLSNPVELAGPFRTLSSIGITTVSTDYGKSGKLEFDSDKFMEAMTPGGTALHDQWMTDQFSDTTGEIQPLSGAEFSGGTFYIGVGTQSGAVTAASDDSLSTLVDRINQATDSTTGEDLAVNASIIDNRLVIRSDETGEENAISFTDTDGVLSQLGIDVSDPDDTEHHIAPDQSSAYVTELMTTAMGNLDTYLGFMVDSAPIEIGSETAPKGRVPSEIKFIENRIDDIDERIADFENRMAVKERGLWEQFSQMEQALASINEQYKYLASTTGMMSGMAQSASSSG